MAHFIEKRLPKSQLKQLLTCTVCMDTFKDPHQLPCGHSLCMECLDGMLKSRLPIQPFCCPNCRAYFGPLIGLHKSYTLHSIVEAYNSMARKEAQKVRKNKSTQIRPVGEPVYYFNLKKSILVLLLVVTFTSMHNAYMWSMERHILTETLQKEQELLREFKPDITDFTLNKDTANNYLHVSDDLLTVTLSSHRHNYPPHSSRFTRDHQVLSNKCVSQGTHYWEVEATGHWAVAVAFKNVTRKSRTFGESKESWCLTHTNGDLLAHHAGKKETLFKLENNRIGVVVDFHKGLITFIEVGATWKHLITFEAVLDQPVCLGLELFLSDLSSTISVKNIFEKT